MVLLREKRLLKRKLGDVGLSSCRGRSAKGTTMRKLDGLNVACLAFVLCTAATIASPAQTFSVLANFDGSNGESSDGSLIQGTDGKFYSTTFGGGAYYYGTVFKITSGDLTTLYSFCAQSELR